MIGQWSVINKSVPWSKGWRDFTRNDHVMARNGFRLHRTITQARSLIHTYDEASILSSFKYPDAMESAILLQMPSTVVEDIVYSSRVAFPPFFHFVSFQSRRGVALSRKHRESMWTARIDAVHNYDPNDECYRRWLDLGKFGRHRWEIFSSDLNSIQDFFFNRIGDFQTSLACTGWWYFTCKILPREKLRFRGNFVFENLSRIFEFS